MYLLRRFARLIYIRLGRYDQSRQHLPEVFGSYGCIHFLALVRFPFYGGSLMVLCIFCRLHDIVIAAKPGDNLRRILNPKLRKLTCVSILDVRPIIANIQLTES